MRELSAACRAQRGFGIVEALVASIVVSVGMLGIAALHAQAVATGRTALHRTIAVHLAADMAERIRANRLAGAPYSGTPADHGCARAGAACGSDEIAQHDLFAAEREAARTLPAGRVQVAFAAGTPPSYTIAVGWDDPTGARLDHRISIHGAD